MTLEFARKEAARRDAEPGTKHYVARRPYNNEDLDGKGYMVLTSVPPGLVEIQDWDTDWQDGPHDSRVELAARKLGDL
jgi:hypothetical protein